MGISTEEECIAGIKFWGNEINFYFDSLDLPKSEKSKFDYMVTAMDNLNAFFLTYKLFYSKKKIKS